MTQHQLIIEYLQEHGSILPAKMAGQIYKETMFGSETSKRCRELRAKGKLRSEGDGKFERFYLVDNEFTNSKTTVYENLVNLTRTPGICCYSYQKFAVHDKNCSEISKQKTTSEVAAKQPSTLF